ncbi:MAG TPA: alpha/beta fold hydrolase [Acetobacteraceae bacterium]|jgi:pimeloyl-ACP methyl ester carboxylesterase|nr:alpha/beta fold hydrolase [Acetobacteraceae bacterium]
MILNTIESGEGPPLALLHGLFGRAGNFGAIQRRLRTRFRVIAIDLRNHGDSAHAASMDYAAMAEDVLETLRAKAALPAAVVGHSMGGKVAMAAALEAPGAVSRLVVADIAPARYPPAFTDYIAAMAAVDLRPGLTRAAADAALAGAVPDPRVRAFLLQNLTLGDTPAWRIGLREIGAAMPVIEGWEAPPDAVYRGPTTFVAGARSDYVKPEHRPAIRALFPAARFVTLKGAGHWVHADDPDGFAAVVEAAAA